MEAKVNNIALVVYLRLNVHFEAKKTNDGSELTRSTLRIIYRGGGDKNKILNSKNYIK